MRGFLRADLEQVTLRWVATGRLVAVGNLPNHADRHGHRGELHCRNARALLIIVPDIPGKPRDSESAINYSWRVSVLDTNSGRVSHSSSRAQFRLAGRRSIQLMMPRLSLFLLSPDSMLLAAGCNISMPDARPSPTVEIEVIATASPASQRDCLTCLLPRPRPPMRHPCKL